MMIREKLLASSSRMSLTTSQKSHFICSKIPASSRSPPSLNGVDHRLASNREARRADADRLRDRADKAADVVPHLLRGLAAVLDLLHQVDEHRTGQPLV